MKTLRFLVLGLIFLAGIACRAQDDDTTTSGWFRVGSSPCPSFTPSTTQELRGNQPTNFFVPSTPIAETITPQIQALADGLQDDPQQIFAYVHDHIRFVLYFGSKKGAQLTLLERSGNDFDQCALLVALLRAAGYSNVQYQFGWQAIPYDAPGGGGWDLHNWWQLTHVNDNWNSTVSFVSNFMGTRGYPAYAAPTENSFIIQRMWVKLTIGSTAYQLDPAFKRHQQVQTLPGFSLINALGESNGTVSNAVMTVAGGTNTANWVHNLDETAIRSKLSNYTGNLLTFLQTNAPNGSVEDVLGGWRIAPAVLADEFAQSTRFPNVDNGGRLRTITWTNQPTNLMSTLKISFPGTNHFWFMPELQGQRLTLDFDSGGMARLWQDDTCLAQHTTLDGTVTVPVVLAVTHPIGRWDVTNNMFISNPTNFANMASTNLYHRAEATYTITYGFETDWSWLEQRQNKLALYLQQGLANGSREVTSEALNIIGLSWIVEKSQIQRMLASQMEVSPYYYHQIGRVAQIKNRGYYLDMYMCNCGEYSTGGDDSGHTKLSNNYYEICAAFNSAFEHGVIEQYADTNGIGASTVKMLQRANASGQYIYLARSGNWSDVAGQLVGYSTNLTDPLTKIRSLITQGYTLLLPQNGSFHVSSDTNTWSGCGYAAKYVDQWGYTTDMPMEISGGYQGGIIAKLDAIVNSYIQCQTYYSEPDSKQSPVSTPRGTIADPVNIADATFEVGNTDLSIGQAEPRGITLRRSYDGLRRYENPAGMAPGWNHNFTIQANTVSAFRAGLGSTTPAQAASILVATTVAASIYDSTNLDAKRWLTTVLIAKWGVDQLIRNGVSVRFGNDTLQFVIQPNGNFTPPPNSTATLARTNSAYSLLMRHGNQFNFNTNGCLTNIVDQYGQSLKLTYNASNWVSSIADWKNRAFTFNYTGNPLRLTSVSNESRVISYGYSTNYSPQGDLISFTDPEHQTCTYKYDTNHQITATLNAVNQLVVTNIYDSQGHVTTQFTQGDTNKIWRVFWSDWKTSEIDPNGGRQDYFFDDKKRLTTTVNELGYATRLFYDGQNHVIQTVSPMNETNRFVYDGNQNRIQAIDAMGYTNIFLYDNQQNLYATIDPRGYTNTFGYNSHFSSTGTTNGASDWVAYDYNADGTLHTRTDAGGATTYGYDNYGQLNSIAYPNGLGNESFVSSASGDVTSHTDARNYMTAFQYNQRRQLTNTIAPTNVTVSVAFDAVGNQRTATDARGNTVTNTWSVTQHLLATTFPATPQGVPTITNNYDLMDRLIASIDPLQYRSLYTNDATGRLISSTDPLLRTTTYGFDADGRQVVVTNAALKTTRQTWDGRGKLLQVIDAKTHVSSRGYDAAGNQVFLTNRNGKLWKFQFDGANRLTNTITPLNRTISRTFNSRGFLATEKDPAARLTSYGYDAKSRLTSRADNLATTFYGYDAANNRTNVVENGFTNGWVFDAYNRPSSYKDINGNLIQYRYDAAGNLTNLVYPGGKTVTYAYDNLNRLTNVTDWAQRKTTITYDLANHVKSITRPNGTYRTLSYDAAGQTTNILEQMGNGLPIALFRLNWTNSGTMAWEFAAPLPHTNSPPRRTMTYDDDNRLDRFNGQSVSNDVSGNLISGPLTNSTFATYAYDARNRLVSVGGVTNVYDAMDNRVAQTTGTNTTVYVVNPNAKLPQVLMRTKNGVTTYYIYGPGLLYEADDFGNTKTYHYDYRGSTVAITAGNGLSTDRIEYSAYGTTTYRTGTTDTPFLFNGRYGVMTDPNGLLYMRARYYNPLICRFVNPDPSGFGGGLNWYAYANGNPISLLDPFGLSALGEEGDFSYWLRGQGQVWLGYGDSGAGFAGAWNMCLHPADTLRSLGMMISTDPLSRAEAAMAMWGSLSSTYDDFASGDPRRMGRATGSILFTATSIAAPFSRGLVAAEGLPPLRQQYINEVLELKDVGNTIRAAGTSAEDTARILHQMRRDLGIQYKDLTPPDKLAEITARNIEKYGDPLGPSVDWLRAQGKTWEQIIESASRPGGKDLGF